MRYLGVDYGRARIGLAVSDPDGAIAFPHSVVSSIAQVVSAVQALAISAIVIGLPEALFGSSNQAEQEVRAFAAELEEALKSNEGGTGRPLPIYFENEIYTSKLAERSSPIEVRDAAAAALILQSFLDRIRQNH